MPIFEWIHYSCLIKVLLCLYSEMWQCEMWPIWWESTPADLWPVSLTMSQTSPLASGHRTQSRPGHVRQRDCVSQLISVNPVWSRKIETNLNQVHQWHPVIWYQLCSDNLTLSWSMCWLYKRVPGVTWLYQFRECWLILSNQLFQCVPNNEHVQLCLHFMIPWRHSYMQRKEWILWVLYH